MSSVQTESLSWGGAGTKFAVSDRLESSTALRNAGTVYIVDADQAAGETLAAMITAEGWCAETFTSGEEFLAESLGLAPGCLIIDVFLPDMSGLELQKRASQKCPHLPVVFLSAISDIPTTVEAMKAGAIEFLTKPYRQAELMSAVKEALERSELVVNRRAEKQALRDLYVSLSLRQRQVMALVSSGLLNKQVGEELGISEITVKAHRGQVMQKMKANSLADLVKMAGKLGIAKNRTAMMVRDRADSAAFASNPLVAGYAFVA
jgi:FixJ family two-component response regulator